MQPLTHACTGQAFFLNFMARTQFRAQAIFFDKRLGLARVPKFKTRPATRINIIPFICEVEERHLERIIS
jgi:hypothetical protein